MIFSNANTSSLFYRFISALAIIPEVLMVMYKIHDEENKCLKSDLKMKNTLYFLYTVHLLFLNKKRRANANQPKQMNQSLLLRRVWSCVCYSHVHEQRQAQIIYETHRQTHKKRRVTQTTSTKVLLIIRDEDDTF